MLLSFCLLAGFFVIFMERLKRKLEKQLQVSKKILIFADD